MDMYDENMNVIRPATDAEIEWMRGHAPGEGWIWLDPEGDPVNVVDVRDDEVVIDLGPVGNGGGGVGYRRPAEGYTKVCIA